jgi:DNA glycosylase AlkZ-like
VYTLGDVAQARLRNERLVGTVFAKPADVVRWLGAVQSQDYAGAKWAVGLRTKDCVDEDVERAFHDGSILRTHVLRPTWHFVVPEDIRWMLTLTAPRVRASMAYYVRKLGLTDRLFGRSNTLIAKALAGGTHLTRQELAGVLGRAGIETAGERLAFFTGRAELDAVICSGPRRGKQFTYALLAERAPAAKVLARDEALAELAVRYFTSHGPALPQDFAWWSGLTLTEARRSIELASRRLAPLAVDGRTYWHGSGGFPFGKPPGKPERNVVHLLPNYDEYLIAYRDRSAATDRTTLPSSPGARDAVFASHLILLDGRLIGGWRRLVEKKTVVVETRLLAPLSAPQRQALAAAAERLAAFIRQPVRLRAAARAGAANKARSGP